MGLPLVVGVDGSDSSLEAVDWAVDAAARHGLPLRLVYASLWERYEGGRPTLSTGLPADAVMAQHILASGVERARQRRPEVQVSGEVLPDDAVSVLSHAGQEASTLVTGSRGRGGLAGLLLGSVSLAVAARAVCPVVVVRGTEEGRRGDFRRVVVGIGDPPENSHAVRFAFEEAAARGSALTAVRAWRRPTPAHLDHPLIEDNALQAYEEQAAADLDEALREEAGRHPDVEVQRRPTEGPAHRVLLRASAEADLIVVGALRRHGRFGRQFGGVPHALLHHSRCPVAVVPQSD